MGINSSVMTYATQEEKRGPFFLLIFYLVIEYARPSFLAAVRPALILQVFLVLALLSQKDKVINLFKEKFFKYYLLMLALMVFHVFTATNNYWAYMHFQRMVTYLVVAIAFCVFLNRPEKVYQLVTCFVFIMALCAISRLAGSGLIGGTGIMGDENDFALAMNVALPLSFFLGKSEAGWKKYFFFTASALFVLGNMASASRGGFLGMAVVGTVCWVYSRQKFKALLAIILLATLAWSFAPAEFKQEISGIGMESTNEGTGKDRLDLWKVAWRAYLDNPILGVGQGNMPIVMETYQYGSAGESAWERGLWGRAIHSVYLTLLPELGLVGLVLLGTMFRDLLRKYSKIKVHCRKCGSDPQVEKLENLNIALLTGVFGFMVTGIFISAFYYPHFWNLAALIVALFLSVSRVPEPSHTVSDHIYKGGL